MGTLQEKDTIPSRKGSPKNKLLNRHRPVLSTSGHEHRLVAHGEDFGDSAAQNLGGFTRRWLFPVRWCSTCHLGVVGGGWGWGFGVSRVLEEAKTRARTFIIWRIARIRPKSPAPFLGVALFKQFYLAGSEESFKTEVDAALVRPTAKQFPCVSPIGKDHQGHQQVAREMDMFEDGAPGSAIIWTRKAKSSCFPFCMKTRIWGALM